MIDAAECGESVLLIAPTGGGKTLAGFLPSLIALSEEKLPAKIHTIYVSPLKALAADIARNLARPVEEMGLNVTIDSRTGDTSVAAAKAAQSTAADFTDDAGEFGVVAILSRGCGKLFRFARADHG